MTQASTALTEGRMPEYRIYRIKDHRIDGPPKLIVAHSDAEAVGKPSR